MLRVDHKHYLEQSRKLDEELVVRFGLESKGERIAFPYLDADGNVVKVKLLKPRPNDGEPKWTAEAGGKLCLFNEPVAMDHANAEALVITEGEIDCLTAVQAGFPHAMSMQNGAVVGEGHKGLEQFTRIADALAKWKWFILATDADEKGIECRETLLGYLGKGRCKTVTYPEGCKDLNDVLQAHGIEAVQRVLREAKPYPLAGVYGIDDYPEQPDLTFFSTDIPGLGRNFAPYRGSLVTVTGIASHGKSTVVNAMLGDFVMRHGLKICMASFEMPVKPFLRDALLRFFRGHKTRVRTIAQLHAANLAAEQIPPMAHDVRTEGEAWIRENFKFIDRSFVEEHPPTLDWLLETARDAKLRHGFDVLVIDPWNRLSITEAHANTYAAEKAALNRLQLFARDLGIVVIVVAHPSLTVRGRDGEVRAPRLLDISGGGHWASMSDLVLAVHRPDLKQQLIEMHVLKTKFFGSGRVGTYSAVYARGIEYFVPAPTELTDGDEEGSRTLAFANQQQSASHRANDGDHGIGEADLPAEFALEGPEDRGAAG